MNSLLAAALLGLSAPLSLPALAAGKSHQQEALPPTEDVAEPKRDACTSTTASALQEGRWDSSAQDEAKNFSANKNDFMDDGLQATFWGSLHKGAEAWAPQPGEPQALKSPDFESGHMDVLLRKNATKAPLVVFVPGILNDLSSPSSKRAYGSLAARGYHVLVVPNSWSKAYVSQGPKGFVPAESSGEARALLGIIRSALLEIGPQNVSSVNLMGESYGGFLGTAAATLDAESEHPIVNGSVTLFSPPLNLITTRHHFDKLIEEKIAAKDQGKNPCPPLTALNVVRIFQWGTARELGEAEKTCMRTLMGEKGMQEPLIAMVQELARKNLVATRYTKDQYDRITFQKHADDFTNGLTKEHPDKDPLNGLKYWITRAQKAGFDRIRIMGALNDPADSPEEWDEMRALLKPGHLIVLPGGGHMGFESLPWFHRFFDAAYGKPECRGFKIDDLKIPFFR